ncbi:MAG TPA: hypothetical protein VGC41_27215 [Kofleriaceae bacterium]
MLRCVALCAAISACVDVPEPAGFAGGLAVTSEADGTHVKSPQIEVTFPTTGVMFPDHLYNAAGVDVIGTDQTCGGEDRIGIVVAPGLTVSAGTTAVASTLDIVDAGPAIVKARVTYTVAYNCPGSTQLSGATDFTIFPSGRIVREDKNIQPTASTLALSASCGCATTQKNFFFGTYWSFQVTGSSQVGIDGSTVSVGETQACSMYTDHGIAVSMGGGTGTNADFYFEHASTHVEYWLENETQLGPDSKSMTSAINLGRAGQTCADIMQPLYDKQLTIAGVSYGGTDYDGVYRGDTAPHDAAFDITTSDTIEPGWAISIDLAGHDHGTITRSPDLGHPAGIAQREDANHYLIYFPDGLAPGETITVTPQ